MATSAPSPTHSPISPVANRPLSSTTSTTKHSHDQLLPRFGADFVSALAASSLVAPLVTLLDKSIVLRTHSAEPLRTIFRTSLAHALRHPLAFLASTPYLLIQGLYASTYLAVNLTDTWSSARYDLPATHIGSGPDKFAVTAAVNMSFCLYKDARFARFFGAGSAPSSAVVASTAAAASSRAAAIVPRASLALFACRDALTIFASFNAPALLAPWVGGSFRAAQFAAPAAVQLLSTPLHLLGLDLYNRPRGRPMTAAFAPNMVGEQGRVGWRDRWQIVKRDWFGASLARMGRIIPAYGVGGVVNREMRTRLMKSFES